jgi:hypothetical protein
MPLSPEATGTKEPRSTHEFNPRRTTMDVPIGARTARVMRQHAFKMSLSTAILFLLVNTST